MDKKFKLSCGSSKPTLGALKFCLKRKDGEEREKREGGEGRGGGGRRGGKEGGGQELEELLVLEMGG